MVAGNSGSFSFYLTFYISNWELLRRENRFVLQNMAKNLKTISAYYCFRRNIYKYINFGNGLSSGLFNMARLILICITLFCSVLGKKDFVTFKPHPLCIYFLNVSIHKGGFKINKFENLKLMEDYSYSRKIYGE